MATLAFDLLVFSPQWKSRLGMVFKFKFNALPFLVVVAVVATRAKAAFVRVIFFVALATCIGGQEKGLGVSSVFLCVAIPAFDLGVAALQFKTRDRVLKFLERTTRPANEIMASPAMLNVAMTTIILLEARSMEPLTFGALSTNVVMTDIAEFGVQSTPARVTLRTVVV